MPFKKAFLITTLLAGLASTGAAYAGEGIYHQVHGGVNFLTNDDIEGNVAGVPFDLDYDADTGFVVGLALGKKFRENYRVEAEITYRDNEIGNVAGVPVDGDVTSYAFMINGYYDFNTESQFTPYIGAGIGYADVEVDTDSDEVFAYQFKAGIAYPVSDNLGSIGTEISYFATEDYEFTSGADRIEASYGNTSLQVFWRNSF